MGVYEGEEKEPGEQADRPEKTPSERDDDDDGDDDEEEAEATGGKMTP